MKSPGVFKTLFAWFFLTAFVSAMFVVAGMDPEVAFTVAFLLFPVTLPLMLWIDHRLRRRYHSQAGH